MTSTILTSPRSAGQLARLARLGTSWVLAIWFAQLYVVAGWGKFWPDSFWAALFDHWGYPPSFRLLIGVLELAGGILIVAPWTTTYAALVLVVVMLGAAGSLATDARWNDVATVAGYVLGLLWVAWEWRGHRLREGREPRL